MRRAPAALPAWLVVAGASVVAASAFAQGPAPPAEPARPRFDILEYHVVGNTVLDLQGIEDAVGPFLGPDRGSDDVDRARAALEAAYHDRGFKTVAVTIPRQAPGEGVIRLEVVENRIGHLTVTGSRFHSIDRIKADAPSLAEDTVPNFAALQADVEALNLQPDRRVTPALKAGVAPGTVDVDLAVDDDLPLHGSLELNNRNSQGTRPLRLVGTLSYDNLWQAGHSLSVSAQTAPQQTGDAKVFFGSYLARFGRSPWSLLGNFIHSDSNIATVGGTNVVGRGNTWGLRAFLTLPGAEALTQSVSAGVEYKDLNNITALADASFETPVRYAPFSLGYNATWRDAGTLLQGGLTFSIADPHIGSDTAALDDNRYRARGQQAYWRGNVGLVFDWGDGLQASLRASGQITDQPLLTSEQFGIGGEDSVRGYRESEALGDYGFSGSAELRSPPLLRDLTLEGTRLLDESRLFAFVDGGRVLLRNPLPEQQRIFSLGSAGVGLRFGIRSALDGSLQWAHVVRPGSGTASGSERVLFRLTGSF